MKLFTLFFTILSLTSAKYCSVSSKNKYSLDTPEHAFMRSQPLAFWATDRSGNLESMRKELSDFVSECKGDKPIIIIYGLPNKDCKAGESSSGFNTGDTYRQFITTIKETAKESLIILEPDALALALSTDCGKQYLPFLREALEIIPDAYLDVGHWVSPDQVRSLELKTKGYSLNLSNYRSNQEMKSFCDKLTNENQRCLIDTSRNYNGPSASATWCNYNGAGINAQFEEDKYSGVWLKPAIELDGNCYGSPDSYTSNKGAGAQDNEWFNILWRQGIYAKQPLPAPQEPSSTQPAPEPTQPAPVTTKKTCWDSSPAPSYNFKICKA